MDWNILLLCLLIIGARIVDVSLGTIRTIFVINGRRGVAFALGFVEVLVWVTVVSRVIANLNHPVLAVAYALGYALGCYVGMTVERWFAFGDQAVRIFTRPGVELATRLRGEGFRVTTFAGQGRDGEVQLLYVQTSRRQVYDVIAEARQLDPTCFYVIEDVRKSSSVLARPAANGVRK